ncbi:MAG: AAA family ATPase [Archangium sp.]|nr:AAA family ATPase [Archangium sp.]
MNELLADLETVEEQARSAAITARLIKKYPSRKIFFTDNSEFLVGPWAAATRQTTVSLSPEYAVRKLGIEEGFTQRMRREQRGEMAPTSSWHLSEGLESFEWKGHRFEVFTTRLLNEYGSHRWSWLISDDDTLIKELFAVVVAWNSEVHGEVLVFSNGCFSKSAELQSAIEATKIEDLVLPPQLAESLLNDVSHFLASRELYEKAGAAWKRGMLLMGPPGNGKTHAIKGLIKRAGLPCLYVKSFSGRHVDPAGSIPQVFARARELAPCVVVLEDLDSLVDDENRSFLLNELDGFAVNDGLLTIASTNHPERLDPSLLHRPSRFDRKYRFELPELDLRRRYLDAWSSKTASPVAADVLTRAAELSNGFTFAYLKEVGLSTLMQWASEGQKRPLGDVLIEVIDQLKQEILATPAGPPPAPKAKPRFPWDFG